MQELPKLRPLPTEANNNLWNPEELGKDPSTPLVILDVNIAESVLLNMSSIYIYDLDNTAS